MSGRKVFIRSTRFAIIWFGSGRLRVTKKEIESGLGNVNIDKQVGEVIKLGL